MAKLIASAGPFAGVRFVQDAPYDNWQKFALNSTDGYFRDSNGESSWVQRPGFTNTNPSTLIDGTHPTQGQTSFVDPSTGTIYRFFVANGVLYRSDSAFATFTNVSPVGIAIDNGATTRVSFLGVGSSLVVTDGVNRPWVMSNFAATPVTGTYIQIDSAGNAWSAWGKPTLYQDSVFFIAQTVPGGSAVQSRVGIVWCEPNQPTVGYTQTGYADFWNIIENGSEPLYAILGTNNGLFYWREGSIGLASGTPSINFSTTATRDYRGEPVGSVSPWAVSLYNNNIFFVDPRGRPWMMALDGDPQPIWLAAYTRLVTLANQSVAAVSIFTVAAIVPELNLYLVAISQAGYGNRMFAFDASSGAYFGMWSINDANPNLRNVYVMDQMLDSQGLRVLSVVTDQPSDASAGYVWLLNSLRAGVWKDTGDTHWGPTFASGYLSHSASKNLQPDMATFLVRSPDTIQFVYVGNGYNASSGSVAAFTNVAPISQQPPPGPASGASSQSSRVEVGLDGLVTRWISFEIVGPLNPTMQWGVQRIEVFGSTSNVGTGDR